MQGGGEAPAWSWDRRDGAASLLSRPAEGARDGAAPIPLAKMTPASDTFVFGKHIMSGN